MSARKVTIELTRAQLRALHEAVLQRSMELGDVIGDRDTSASERMSARNERRALLNVRSTILDVTYGSRP